MSHPSRVRGLKSGPWLLGLLLQSVAPLAGAWIEILNPIVNDYCIEEVAPLAGAWIEICGLRSELVASKVAPLAGAWIEILFFVYFCYHLLVAPLAGAWIEIAFSSLYNVFFF